METLKMIEAKGDLLFGPAVAPWFEGDCSVPGRLGKKLLNAKLALDACVIHDWCYMLIPILYEHQSPLWNLKLHTADAELRWNLTKMRKKRWFGRIWGYIYYKGVRMPFVGGRRAVLRNPDMHPRGPKDLEQLLELIVCARRFNDGHLTVRAVMILGMIANRLGVDIRKELKQ